MAIVSASPVTQGLLDRLRSELRDFCSYERKHYVAFKSDSTNRVFAFLNPLKAHIRLFLLLEENEDPVLSAGPSTGHYAKWSSVFYISELAHLPKANELIERSFKRDMESGLSTSAT